MTHRVDILGASGERYAFYPLEPGADLRSVGATFVLAEDDGAGLRVLFVGETDNLLKCEWAGPLRTVRKSHPRANVFLRLHVTRRMREPEVSDIRAARASPAAARPARTEAVPQSMQR